MEPKLTSGNPPTLNVIKMILQMSPDRKITWFMIVIGAIKILGLDAWLPMPKSPEQAIQIVTHANKDIADLAEQIRQQVHQGDDSMVSFLSMLGGIAYVVLKKAKEYKLISVGGNNG